MEKTEYLIARIGKIRIGIYCRDLLNVYNERIRLCRMFYQNGYFRGLTVINNQVMQVLDLRKRIGMAEREKTDIMTLITFNTGAASPLAVVVDEILGMKSIANEFIKKNDKTLSNRPGNIDLLFPMVAVMSDGTKLSEYGDNDLIHLLDATYLEKHEPIEDSGEMEFF